MLLYLIGKLASKIFRKVYKKELKLIVSTIFFIKLILEFHFSIGDETARLFHYLFFWFSVSEGLHY
jgi:hypothetical protein